jgi:hypothetical protein
MADDSPSTPDANTGRFAVLTNPVRGFAERTVARAWPGRRAKTQPVSAPAGPDVAASGYETPAPSFVTSEVISAFHLQQLHLPNRVERVTRGAATGGKVAIVASMFALVSLIGLGLWASSAKTSSDVTPAAKANPLGAPQANTAELALKPNLQVPAVPAETTPASESERAPQNAAGRADISLNGPKQHASRPSVSHRTPELPVAHPPRNAARAGAPSHLPRSRFTANAELAGKDAVSASASPITPDGVAGAAPINTVSAEANPRPSLEVPRIRRQPNTDE